MQRIPVLNITTLHRMTCLFLFGDGRSILFAEHWRIRSQLYQCTRKRLETQLPSYKRLNCCILRNNEARDLSIGLGSYISIPCATQVFHLRCYACQLVAL
jgi:hypothetical protein